jgi:hypothetical protein
LKAAELDFPSAVPKTGLYRQGIQAVSINLKSLVIKLPTRVVLTRVVPTRVVQSYSKEVQFLPACCEQRVAYPVIGISDLELESPFLEQNLRGDLKTWKIACLVGNLKYKNTHDYYSWNVPSFSPPSTTTVSELVWGRDEMNRL